MKIKVTKTDIDKGVPREPDYCPVALAIKRTFNADAAYVFGDHCEILVGGLILDRTLPLKVSAFISSFDNFESPKPFTFRIRGLK